ncbi:MAG TPA: prephenate dehydratase domain-containing protein, partial [Acidobacteriaceae bacterium]|nr:prephenate dehydratase domain-containing protein [Acidobacteriaceae bacterium]
HEAALAMLPDATIVPCTTAADVFQAVLTAHADVAVIPIENSLAGSVVDFYDLLFEHDLCIVQEKLQRIRHNLIARPGVLLPQITQVLSHPIALAQCRKFFEAHPQMERVAHYDTAGSVKTIMQTDSTVQAAIASRQAAKQYGGQILQADIEDSAENFTRFLLLYPRHGPHAPAPPKEVPNKMCLVFFLENRPGALVQVLEVFSALHLNLTKIESRPVRGHPWEYMFCADVQLPNPEAADIALSHLQPVCTVVKELGRYRTTSV